MSKEQLDRQVVEPGEAAQHVHDTCPLGVERSPDPVVAVARLAGLAGGHEAPRVVALQNVDGDYRTVRRESIPPEENLLQPVFRNGKLLRKWDFTELIARSEREVTEYYYAACIAPMSAGR